MQNRFLPCYIISRKSNINGGDIYSQTWFYATRAPPRGEALVSFLLNLLQTHLLAPSDSALLGGACAKFICCSCIFWIMIRTEGYEQLSCCFRIVSTTSTLHGHGLKHWILPQNLAFKENPLFYMFYLQTLPALLSFEMEVIQYVALCMLPAKW